MTPVKDIVVRCAWRLCLVCCFLPLAFNASGAASPVVILDQPGWCNWCPSPAYLPDGRVALAFSRWPTKFGFEAWCAKSEIALAISKSGPLGPYEFVKTILPGSGRDGDFDRDVTHNPCLFVDGGKYYLYYMGTYSDLRDGSAPGASSSGTARGSFRTNQRVGVAVADCIEGPYRRTGKPLFPLEPDMTMHSNPAVCKMPNGKYLVIVKWGESDGGIVRGWPKCRVNLFAAIGDTPLGPFKIVNRDVFGVNCANFPGEDPYLWTEGETICCAIHDMGHFYSPEERALIRFESKDGVKWTNMGVLFPRGEISRLERPAILCGKDGSRLLFAASKPDRKGANSLIVAYPGVIPEPHKTVECAAVDVHGESAELRIVGTNGQLRVERRGMTRMADGAWRVKFATDEMRGVRSVDVVPDWARVPKGEGYWVFPDGHYGNFTRDEGAYSNRRARLAMYGVCRPQGTYVAIVKGLRTEFGSHVEAKGGVYEIFPRFEIEKIEFDPYEDIVIDCYRLTGADANYSGMARRYRAWQLGRGEVRPLAERIKTSPALAYSAKSVFMRYKFGRTFRRDVDHKSFATNTPPMTVDHTFDEFMGALREAKALGMNDVDMCLVGWQREGHDGPFPDHFPVDPRFGGEGKMREAVKLGRDLGYRMSVHLNYHNYYPAAKLWRDEDVCKGPDGKPRPYWLLPAGLAHFSCFEVMVNRYVDSDFAHLRDIGIDGILHHDVTSAEYPTPCHDPRHPNSRGKMAGWQLRLCEKCRETFGGSSSESGLDHIARGLDSILYVAWDVKRNPLIDGMLPVWPIVYNGICMSQPFYGTIDASYPRVKGEKFSEGTAAYHWIPTPEERMLKVFEWGGRPAFYYNPYDDLRPLKRMYDLWQPLRHLQLVFIREHVTLSAGVTATRYENGEEVVCNATGRPFSYRGKTVAPMSYRLF